MISATMEVLEDGNLWWLANLVIACEGKSWQLSSSEPKDSYVDIIAEGKKLACQKMKNDDPRVSLDGVRWTIARSKVPSWL
jgi:hypothetical protein